MEYIWIIKSTFNKIKRTFLTYSEEEAFSKLEIIKKRNHKEISITKFVAHTYYDLED